MKILFLCTIFVLAAATSEDKRQLVGICVEECSMTLTDSQIMAALGIKSCPDGQVCQSNGCGHTCQPDGTITKPPSHCSNVICRMFCANGFQLGSDGCPICKCA
ncbi:hypothetical protein PoB_005207700 [Plakobranchus ocellatus]|uniref:Antistasin-like domain-containing protein n=1 Tax=Plakobranchus ocellatus TaxID=259542 RepID=A0AAV4C1U0_9GAST|nr:hypothetical protein PoB_005207700 [Plakobranchus ocellatus]